MEWIDYKSGLCMDPRSVAVWPNGLGSDKHANKEETGGEGGGGAGAGGQGKTHPRSISQFLCNICSTHISNNYPQD